MNTQKRAIFLVNAAKKRGLLKKLDGSVACVNCKEPARHYDHRNYADPLDVEPVCISCNLKRGSAIHAQKKMHKIRLLKNPYCMMIPESESFVVTTPEKYEQLMRLAELYNDMSKITTKTEFNRIRLCNQVGHVFNEIYAISVWTTGEEEPEYYSMRELKRKVQSKKEEDSPTYPISHT